MELQLKGYRLTTAEILYHMPDHPALLQSFLWQDYDLVPKLPRLQKFLDFWSREIDGVLHSVVVAEKKLITAEELNARDFELTLH
jgi:uncharacterized protein Usg